MIKDYSKIKRPEKSLNFFRIDNFNSSTRCLVIFVLISAVTSLYSRDEIRFDKISDWEGAAYIKNLTKKADGIISAHGKTYLRSVKSFKIDPAKKYYLQGRFRKANESGKARLFFGFYPLDKNGRVIMSVNTLVVPRTDTELVAEATKGSTELKIKDGTEWKDSFDAIALHTDPAGGDLPNFNIIRSKIVSITKGDGYWLVKLKKTLDVTLQSGTLLRQHHGGGCMYYAAGRPLTEEWEQINGFAQGILNKSGYPQRMFPLGTVSIKIFLFLNYEESSAVTEFKDITIEEE